MILFKATAEVNVVEGFDETTQEPEGCDETFNPGDFLDAFVMEKNGEYVDLACGDGSICLNLPTDTFIAYDLEQVPHRFRSEIIKFGRGEQVSRDFSTFLENNEEVATLCAKVRLDYLTVSQ
jgi:hypothetical protein